MGRLFERGTRAVLLAGWLVLAGGCATPNSPGAPQPSPLNTSSSPTGQPAPPGSSASDKRFIIAPELANVLHVLKVNMSKPQGSNLKVQVNVQNASDATLRFQYRITWFDQDGAPVPMDGEDFVPWLLMKRELSSIVVTAPAPTAADFGIIFVPLAQ